MAPVLTPEEVRVLGCLMEKETTTPDGYPLTVNALLTACNQTTNRFPVVRYDEHAVTSALASLREAGLTRIVYSTSNRAPKHRHVAREVLGLDLAEQAVLCVLALRGPQTVGELKGRTERQHAFADLGEVDATLERLAARPEPLVVRLARRPGQKDARWMHLLGGPVDDDMADETSAPAPTTPRTDRVAELTGRVDALEARVSELTAVVDQLRTLLD
jgi:uncharacterized protein YceH (UPF0502 family)